MKKSAIVCLLVAVIAFSAFLSKIETSSDKGLRSQRQQTVKVGQAKESRVRATLEFIGTAVSNESVNITSSITQKISQINFSDCDFVKKGDVLVQLNVEKQKALQKQAEINLQEQQREVTRLAALKTKNVIAAKEYDAQNTRLLDAQAKLAEVEEEIKEGTIVAPFDGMLGIRQVSVGALLTPGTVITTIDDIKNIKVDFAVPEKYLSLINKDCPITVTSIAVPGKKFYGKVLAVSPRISTVSRTIPVRGLIANDDYLLRSGMLLNVTIEMQDRNALLIPEESIVNVGEKHFVFVMKENNKVQKREIEIGQRESNLVEVSNGLGKNEIIVTDGVVRISDGDVVKVLPDKSHSVSKTERDSSNTNSEMKRNVT